MMVADVLYWSSIAKIGFIPCDSKTKRVYENGWQNLDLDKIDYEANEKAGLYKNGIAIRLGRCLKPFQDRFSFALDFDGWDAVLEWFGSWENVLEMSKKTRIEWHQDKCKLHMILFSNRPVTNRKIKIKDSLLEIRCEKNLLYSHPSFHYDGNQYIPLGTNEISILTEPQLLALEAKIDFLCEGYMSDANKSEYIQWLENPDNWRSLGVGQGRHNALLVLGTSYYYRYVNGWRDMTDDQRREKLWEMNLQLTIPKPESEFNSIWKWIVDKHRKTRDQEHEKLDNERRNDKTKKDAESAELIEEATESIIQRHHFVTLEESDVIHHYNNGAYTPDGEVMIKKILENSYQYDLNISKRAEIREHIKNKTYHKLSEFDSDVNIINMANGLYNIQTDQLSPHTPKHFSINQKPIIFDPNARVPSQFIKFIKQIVYPSDVWTLIELIAYTFYRDNPFEIITTLNGGGSNGKSVLFALLTTLQRVVNVSNVSLKTMVERPYGLYDLVGKDVNLDTELSSGAIYDTAILKKITGRQPTRVEQKNQKAFDTSLHAKLWLSANST